ncbi:MurR/RpiR family transcriptional regulator [Shimazuella sp. AN120528]|uniref:MurR/RpiR family transcriptional regulator n=1 Tax=Shimazuella soli TaxID=1892854 RepID=UPI001F0F07CD|nr:MurR/RpiR family transcriptional regulator [Shimazuella soli]MCH5584968.1 MurR/RpiR family transcriptional regulator [Shimazuella soli]
MEVDFRQLVQGLYSNLSTGQKKVAEYILDNFDRAAFLTAEQIGREIKVSQTTVIRLSYALGFRGFSEMQQTIQAEVLSKKPSSVVEKTANLNEKASIFTPIIEKDIDILQRMSQEIDEEHLWKAIDWLLKADSILVIGYRSSYAAAHWFSFGLGELRDHVDLNPTSGHMGKLLTLSQKSVVFIISYPRYSPQSLIIAEHAKHVGAKVIAVTDRVLSPIANTADLCFYAETNLMSGYNSIAASISLLNLFLVGLQSKLSTEDQSRRKNLEQLYSQLGIFSE